MTNNFDLKSFLIKNKMTRNSKLLAEGSDSFNEQDEEIIVELDDYLINKALDFNDVDCDEKVEFRKTHFKCTYRVETSELNYSLILSTTFLFDGDEDGGFQGDYITLTDFDKIGPSWEEYEDELIDFDDVDIESLNRKTQNRLEQIFEELKTDWYDDQFNN
jgi:hypothetical protein